MNDRIEEIRGRLEKATPGPWRWFEDRYGDYLATPDRGRLFIIRCFRKGMQGATVRFRVKGLMEEGVNHPDAALIAHAPDDIAYLLDEVGRLRGEVERCEERVDAAYGDGLDEGYWSASAIGDAS